MKDGARREVAGFRELDHGFDADRPSRAGGVRAASEVAVQRLADGPDGSIAHHGEGRANIHAGHVRRLGLAVLVGALMAAPPPRGCLRSTVRARACPASVHESAVDQLLAHPLVN